MRCAGCIARIEPSSPIYSDLDSDDDFCVKCGGYFVERKFAIVVAAPLFLNPLDKSTS
jgi:hypothetical protein